MKEILKEKELSKKKAQEIQEVLLRNQELEKKKINDFNEKQKQIQIKKEEIEKKQKIENERKLKENLEKEEHIKETLRRNERLEKEKKEKILKLINKREENTLNFQRKRSYENLLKAEEIQEYRIIREERVKIIARLKENNRNKLYKSLLQKSERLNEFKLMKLKIIEKKKKIQKELSRKKHLYNQKLQSLFSNKGLTNRSVKIIRKMFPDNEKINELIDSYRSNNLKKLRSLSQSNLLNINNSISQSRETNKSHINFQKKIKKNDNIIRNYNDNTNISMNVINHSPNQFSFYLTSIDNKKNLNDKINIRNFFNQKNNISIDSNENIDNSFENNQSKRSCDGNDKKKFRKLKEEEIKKKVNQFKKE